ncbi:hypothetical protein AVEN_86844-1 [Araneus ventricosus]|uniref:Uncharacterized protein n=1 Tax=Araneus ventricosus TaxID=182803 RepID=A0A4Y2D1W7_ARAVE|nr:hypothetical protein AVEN_86844-1 [Araneus ventricosus]
MLRTRALTSHLTSDEIKLLVVLDVQCSSCANTGQLPHGRLLNCNAFRKCDAVKSIKYCLQNVGQSSVSLKGMHLSQIWISASGLGCSFCTFPTYFTEEQSTIY